MTPQEARELFSDAQEEALAPEQRQAFFELLAQEEALAAEYRAFCATLAAVRSQAAGAPETHAGAAPNLLPGVQRRLRVRSRGRFYGDRFAERVGVGPIAPVLWALLVLALIAIAWFASSLLDIAVPLK